MFSRHRYIRQLLVCFALLALGLRSLIPVGYMPDFSGHGKGLFPIVICDGFAHITHDDHVLDCPMHSHGNRHSGGLCPFGDGGLAAFNPASVPIATVFAYMTVPLAPALLQSPDKHAIFNNASPRSPPFFS